MLRDSQRRLARGYGSPQIPAAAQGAIQSNQIGSDRRLTLYELIFVCVKITLRIQHRQKIDETCFVLLGREIHSQLVNASGYASSIGQGSTTISANSGTISASTTLTVTAVAPVLVGLQISPTNPSVPLGNTQQFTVTAVYSDSSAQNVTTSVTWSSSNTGVASIFAGGLVRGVSQGASIIP